MEQFFAPCPRGLARVLADELTAIGAVNVQPYRAGVSFEGEMTIAYRANLYSRIASRILWQVAHFPYQCEEDIYCAVLALPWPDWFEACCTINVEVNAQHCPLKSLDFVTLRIKDAICDKFRERTGVRPSVATQAPDVRIHSFFDATHGTLSLDLSGEPLFKRWTREHMSVAPLKKNLAAGILYLSGWKPGTPLLDPLCGSGTLLIEAAQMALGVAPGVGRNFSFMKLKNFDSHAWESLLAEAKAKQLPPQVLPIYGSDLYGYALKSARKNLISNGLANCVFLKQANVLEISPPAPSGTLITNLPYGIRMGESEPLAALYPKLGDTLKQKFAGWNAYLFSGDLRLPKLIRLTASKKIPLFNGQLECRLYQYCIVAGSNRR